jgi:hypothetical protein
MVTKSIELNPKNGAAYFNRGIANQMLHNENGTCADLKKALEYGVENAKSFINASCND